MHIYIFSGCGFGEGLISHNRDGPGPEPILAGANMGTRQNLPDPIEHVTRPNLRKPGDGLPGVEKYPTNCGSIFIAKAPNLHTDQALVKEHNLKNKTKQMPAWKLAKNAGFNPKGFAACRRPPTLSFCEGVLTACWLAGLLAC